MICCAFDMVLVVGFAAVIVGGGGFCAGTANASSASLSVIL